MDTPISRAEHEEFVKRMDEANKRQSKRIELLENDSKDRIALTASVEKLALNMENMLNELKEHGVRLKKLEEHDGKMWRKAVDHLITAIIGIIVGYIFTQIGM